ncbi:hypothetical protein ABH309_18920 [Chromobacterium piscinae]|uniref:Uncharacterized protein n=1 Tax=Chromobacterium piscinae TaxID=686831 RepID=A0ABV0HBS5_9NEIS
MKSIQPITFSSLLKAKSGPTLIWSNNNGENIQKLARGIGFVKNSPEKLHDELCQMNIAALKCKGVSAKNRLLAGYLFMRASQHKAIDGKTLQTLCMANDTVNKTRELLYHGRGNVSTDLNITQESSRRTVFSRSVESEFAQSTAFGAAIAARAGAGNCGEHAELSTALHASKLLLEEVLLRVGGIDVDHEWSVLCLPDGNRIVIDAWAEGSAVMAEDSNFSRDVLNYETILCLELNSGIAFAKEVQAVLDELKKDPNVERHLQACIISKKDNPYEIWLPTSVVSDRFIEKFRTSVQQRARKSVKSQLLNEIIAIGVGRSLGANINQAKKFSHNELNSTHFPRNT